MSHADDAHALKIQLATALRERDEARALKLEEVMGATKRVCDERDAANARAEKAEAKLRWYQTAGFAEALAAARRECEMFRRLLWLRHGCSPAFLYGDDGEMQCGDAGCLLDFKRQSAEEIEARWIAANHAALAAPTAASGEEGTR